MPEGLGFVGIVVKSRAVAYHVAFRNSRSENAAMSQDQVQVCRPSSSEDLV